MNLIQRRRLIGIAILLALVVVGGAVAVALPKGVKQKRITAFFPKSIGLFPQSRVRVLGVAIGRVTSVTPEGSKVKVVMNIDASRKVPANATAVIVPISLIADRYIQLTPVYKSGPVLADGAVINIDHTAIPAELDDLLAQLKKLLDAVRAGTEAHPESIGAAIKNLAAALEGTGQDFSKTLGGSGSLAGAITGNESQLVSTTVHLAHLLSSLAQRRDELSQLNVRMAQSLGAIAAENGALDGALANLAVLTEQLDSLVKAHRVPLKADLNVLAKTAGVLMRHQDSLKQGLDWLHVLADGAEQGHNKGAVDHDHGPPHIDVRDMHLAPCPLGVPPSVCLLTALTGGIQLPVLPGSAGPSANGPAASGVPGPTPKPLPPNPLNLLNLLPRLPLLGESTNPSPAPTNGGLIGKLGGLLTFGLWWLL